VATRGRGPAYPFWERVQRALDEQDLTQAELVERSGVHPATIGRLRTAAPRDRVTRRKHVLAIAGVLAINEDEALQLAGLVAREPDAAGGEVDVRDAIVRDPRYNDDEKHALLGLLDVLDAAKRGQQGTDRTA
jgi:transcriptional regulator with XRE-family HTH domain